MRVYEFGCMISIAVAAVYLYTNALSPNQYYICILCIIILFSSVWISILFIVVSNTLVERMEVLNPIEVYGISYQYAGTKDLAVKDITFHVKSNEIVGLLGHNGSGKNDHHELHRRLISACTRESFIIGNPNFGSV